MVSIARIVGKPGAVTGSNAMACACKQLAAAVKAASLMPQETQSHTQTRRDLRELRRGSFAELQAEAQENGLDGSICVIAPGGGSWGSGESLAVRWVHTGRVKTVKVSLWRDVGESYSGEFVRDLGIHRAEHGCLDFTPNAGLAPSSQYYFEVEAMELEEVIGRSQVFGLLEGEEVPHIQIITPTAKSTWRGGTSASIRWRSHGSIPTVSLKLQCEDVDDTEVIIATEKANNGAGFFFLVEPGLPASSFYYIVVESDSDKAIASRSECFAINNGGEQSQNIKVRNPCGSSLWQSGEMVTVTWEYRGYVPEVTVSLWSGKRQCEGDHLVDLAKGVKNVGKARFRVPMGLKAGRTYYVIVTSGLSTFVVARSEYFAINTTARNRHDTRAVSVR